jgi:O-antigen ligase
MGYSSENDTGRFLYYGLLGYTLLFFSQLASRLPFLAAFRPEFVLGALMMAVCTMHLVSGKVDLKENRLNQASILFFAVLLLTVPFALVKTRAYDAFFRIFKFFTIYLMIICALNSEKKLRGFVYLYVALICLIFVQPFLLSLQGKGFIYNNHMMRLAGVTGYFAHPNMLGIVTSSNLPFLYFLMVRSQSKLTRVVFFCLLGIAFRVIMLTQSRTGMVGAAAFLLFLWLKSRKKAAMAIVLVACMGITWVFMPPNVKNRFLSLGGAFKVMTEGRSAISSEEEGRLLGSMASRWELMKYAFAAFLDNPIIGVGVNNFSSYSGRRWGTWMPPHNTYLQVMAETGIVGTIALLLVIFYTFSNFKEFKIQISRVDSDTRFLRMVSDATAGYYFVFLIVSIFGIELFSNSWWIAGGMSVVLLRIANNRVPIASSNVEETDKETNIDV